MPISHSSQYAALTDAQYIELGKAVVEWANAEELLGVLLARLLGTPDFLARTFTAPLSAARLQESIDEALQIHRFRYNRKFLAEGLIDEISKLNQALTTLRATRNKIAHFCWWRQSDDEVVGMSFAGGVPTPQSERRNTKTLSLSELKAHNSHVYALVERLIKIVDEIPEIKEDALFPLRLNAGP